MIMNWADRLNRVGLRTKVIGMVLVIILLLTLAIALSVRYTFQTTLRGQLEEKVVSISRDLASRSADLVVTGNIFALHRLARETMENNTDVRYVIFLDREGNVFAHTFSGRFPPDLIEANRLFAGETLSLQRFQTEEGVLRDVAVPIFPGSLEMLRVGFLEHSLQAALREAMQQLVVIAASGFFVSAVVVYLLLTRIAINPINSLLATVQSFSPGEMGTHLSVGARDELGQLTAAFNSMVQRITEAQKMRNNMMQRILHAQEEERRRIARELHDEAGQSLMTMLISLHLLEEESSEEPVKEKCREFNQLLVHMLESIRLVSWKISPLPLADLGLDAALVAFVKKYTRKKDWDIKLQISGLEDNRLPSEVETALYRIVQEGLTNAARHGKATETTVSLLVKEDRASLSVVDNGMGFDTAILANGTMQQASIGLASVQERITLLGGTFMLHSSPGKGTTLQAIIPLEKGGEGNFRKNPHRNC